MNLYKGDIGLKIKKFIYKWEVGVDLNFLFDYLIWVNEDYF